MRHIIVCPCEASFEVDAPESFDIDAVTPDAILGGEIMSFGCPECGEPVRVEFPARFFSNSLGLDLYLVPEADRVKLNAGKASVPSGTRPVVGFAELAEALRIARDGLDHRVAEGLKLMRYDKALSVGPESELRVLYEARRGESLEFRIHGLKKDEIAVIKLGMGDYEETKRLMERQKGEEPWKSLLEGGYADARRCLGMIEGDEGAGADP